MIGRVAAVSSAQDAAIRREIRSGGAAQGSGRRAGSLAGVDCGFALLTLIWPWQRHTRLWLGLNHKLASPFSERACVFFPTEANPAIDVGFVWGRFVPCIIRSLVPVLVFL